jgi:hypothetical protein
MLFWIARCVNFVYCLVFCREDYFRDRRINLDCNVLPSEPFISGLITVLFIINMLKWIHVILNFEVFAYGMPCFSLAV